MITPTIEEKDRDATRTTMNGKPVFTVEAKSIINTKSGFAKKLLCDGFTFSTGDACAFSCAFCYVDSMFTKLPRIMKLKEVYKFTHEQMVVRRGNALEILRGELIHPSGHRKWDSPEQKDRVIYASPAVDVAANMDLVRETIDACSLILSHTPWHIRLLSKSNLLPKVGEGLVMKARNDPAIGFTEVDVRERMIFGVSTGTLDDGVAAAFEQKTANVSARIRSLHWLQDKGFRTFGMICPSLPFPDSVAYFRFSHEAAEAIRAHKCENVWAEVINVRGDSMVNTCEALARAGHFQLSELLKKVSSNEALWEEYNRATFLAHAKALASHPGKLRFLTYAKKHTHAWWEERKHLGAVLL